MRTGTNNSLFRTGLLLYVSTRGLSPQQAQAHENSKAFTLVTLHTNRTASNSSRKIRRWCSPQQKFTTQLKDFEKKSSIGVAKLNMIISQSIEEICKQIAGKGNTSIEMTQGHTSMETIVPIHSN
ncbi:uncharacterized protein LOC111906496 isoform X2 [Lactuca sativa]|uniref:uncharacterized protein LOC111906496 isoform X2 n=1 Tax=Lactuca sativa TaxID=4236 RepID=UPI000CD85E7A|nr:uncharacterized protein LOC111906496 isoform X2 [Lactuca sativa]